MNIFRTHDVGHIITCRALLNYREDVPSRMQSGRYFVDFNPTNLHNGTYYYNAVLITKTKTYYKNGKMMKIR
jgi:hypothetical protein